MVTHVPFLQVAKIMAEIQELRKTLSPWNQEAESLDDMMSSAQMVIKDRATQRTLHFGSELQVGVTVFLCVCILCVSAYMRVSECVWCVYVCVCVCV